MTSHFVEFQYARIGGVGGGGWGCIGKNNTILPDVTLS